MEPSHHLGPDGWHLITNALTSVSPTHETASDDELSQYVITVTGALRALQPWTTTLPDQIETLHLLESLLHLFEIHSLSIAADEGNPTLHTVVSGMRQSLDRRVAQVARKLFEHLCEQHAGRS